MFLHEYTLFNYKRMSVIQFMTDYQDRNLYMRYVFPMDKCINTWMKIEDDQFLKMMKTYSKWEFNQLESWYEDQCIFSFPANNASLIREYLARKKDIETRYSSDNLINFRKCIIEQIKQTDDYIG